MSVRVLAYMSYENIGEELPEDVIILCDGCHELFSNRLPTAPEKVCH
jgi:hypothetical protein